VGVQGNLEADGLGCGAVENRILDELARGQTECEPDCFGDGATDEACHDPASACRSFDGRAQPHSGNATRLGAGTLERGQPAALSALDAAAHPMRNTFLVDLLAAHAVGVPRPTIPNQSGARK